MLPSTDLRPLHGQFRNLPCQVSCIAATTVLTVTLPLLKALSAGLAGVVSASGEWTPEDNYWFNNR